MNVLNRKMEKLGIRIWTKKKLDPRYITLEQVSATVAYVDKSLFIKEFLDSKEIVLIMAPSGFGKTVNMDTLKQFLLGNSFIFESHHLKIRIEHPEFFKRHCRKHPVIHVNFAHIDCTSHATYLSSMKDLLFATFNEHAYLTEKTEDGKFVWSDLTLRTYLKFPPEMVMIYMYDRELSEELTQNDVIQGLRILSIFLYLHWNEEVIVLIDEYDAPLKQIMKQKNMADAELILTDFTSMVSAVLNNSECVERALINTCFCPEAQVPTYRRHLFLNNPKFSKYYGFTKEEVVGLFKCKELKRLRRTLDDVHKWYGGYELADETTTMYNSRSILTYLTQSVICRKPVLSSHWFNWNHEIKWKQLFAVRCIREKIETLLNGGEIEVPMTGLLTVGDILVPKSLIDLKPEVINEEAANTFIQFLCLSGYFSVKRTTDDNVVVKIPNLETKYELEKKCHDVGLFQRKYKLDQNKIEEYGNALKKVAQNKDSNALIGLKNAVQELFASPAVLPTSDNQFCSLLYTLAYCEDLYVAKVKRGEEVIETLDFLIVEENTGIMMEVRLDSESAEKAHSGIFDYESDVFEYSNFKEITDKVYVGLHLDKERNVTLCYSVNQAEGEKL
ncbi:hypothetical protein Zmor_024449 [Zophobas morio]|uniref:AAA-ATPase-like domain-containing protein n=1 Tax=Zophobas morio TaxID=2755281 RepID=A0AA38M8B6_9CUCU|nr:hypothetical protein Zmor_024449 [Zophobas morio]